MAGKPALLCICLTLVTGCGSGNPGNASVERDIERGLAEIRSGHDRRTLQAKLTAVVARLRSDQPESDSRQRARALAIAGFEAKLTSIRAEREFYENDSGQVKEATIDAARADAFRNRAEDLLRAAERALKD
jgi:hypothetical protein